MEPADMKALQAAQTNRRLLVGESPAQNSQERGKLSWFAAIPVAMLLDPTISAEAIRLAGILLHYDGPRGCTPKIQSLTRDLAVSRDTIFRLLEELERYGFLTREKRGRNNSYRLHALYDQPVRPDDIRSTRQLAIENAPPRRPIPRKSLRKARATSAQEPQADPKQVASVRPIASTHTAKSQPTSDDHRLASDPHSPSFHRKQVASVPPIETPAAADDSPQQVASMRPIKPEKTTATQADHVASVRPIHKATRSRLVAPVLPNHVAPVLPIPADTSHPCDPHIIKNHISKNHQHQEAAGDDDLSETTGLERLQLAGVHLALHELGIHSGRARALTGTELSAWAHWVQDGTSPGITDKAAFAAAKIRMGCALEEIFPAIKQRNDAKTAAQKEQQIQEQAQQARINQANDLISRLSPAERIELREKALNDPGVWAARNSSLNSFKRTVEATERRLILGECQPSTISRDHSAYPPLPIASPFEPTAPSYS
jgi:hypothetical protein